MAIRRLHYTGRKRLKLEDMRVSIQQPADGECEFYADLSFSKYELPPNALVFVEAYRQTSWMRFPYGTIGQLTPPQSRTLHEFGSAEGILFRVRVTSAGDSREGLLLAEANRIHPKTPEQTDQLRISLLPTKPDSTLEEQVYRVDFSDGPLLLINSRAGDWRGLARDPVFVSLTFPSIIREVLVRIFYVEQHFELEDLDDWRCQWLHFCSSFPGVEDPPNENDGDAIDEWVDGVVATFCRQSNIYQTFQEYWTGVAP